MKNEELLKAQCDALDDVAGLYAVASAKEYYGKTAEAEELRRLAGLAFDKALARYLNSQRAEGEKHAN